MMNPKSILLLIRTSPYQGAAFGEALDALLVAAAFEQRCSLMLIDDAVYALLPDQDGVILGVRTPGKMLIALPDYEVENLYVCAQSLAQRHLSDTTTVVSVQHISPHDQAELIARHDVVWSC